MQDYSWSEVTNNFESFFVPFYRWYSAREWDSFIFYLAFLISVFIILHKDKDKIGNQYFNSLNSILVVSFFVTNTFFIVSLFPVILGQPLNTRFLTILLPFSFISIIFIMKYIIDNSIYKILSLLLIGIFLITFFSKPIYSLYKQDEDWGYLALSSHYKNSIFDRYNQYSQFERQLKSYDCIYIKSSNPHLENIIKYLKLFVTTKNDFDYIFYEKYFKNKLSVDCNNNILIYENKILY